MDETTRYLNSLFTEAGIPIPSTIIGRQFRFVRTNDGMRTVIGGTITGFSMSEEEIVELTLFVSTPKIGGERLDSIRHFDGEWIAYVESIPGDGAIEQLPGDNELTVI